jgi:hypothetical protein
MDGHGELLRILAASLDAIPLGQGALPPTLGPLLAFISASFLAAFGVVGGAILVLFVADLSFAMLSRTVPQCLSWSMAGAWFSRASSEAFGEAARFRPPAVALGGHERRRSSALA